jgi:hypothetical protein
MTEKTSDDALRAAVTAYFQVGNQRGASKLLGISQPQFCQRIADAKKRGLYKEPEGDVKPLQAIETALPKKGKVKRYILTCMQNYTHLHPCWPDLLALAEHYDAELLISTIKYNKDAQGQRAQAKWESREQEQAAMYPEETLDYICDERVDLAPNLTWCGELNIMPTAEDPLSGLNSYTHRKSTIVPHPKLAMHSVASMPGEGVKLLYTTGCITQRNYIKRKVGFKAEHYHNYGGLIVEVNHEGHWWVRQLTFGPDGAIHDLNLRVKKGAITEGRYVEDICWGDVHAGKSDPVVADISWGKRKDSMLETLKPRSQHVHDLLDFGARSHHTRKDPHEVFRSFVTGGWELTQELKLTANCLWGDIARPWCNTVVVDSNHDRHLIRWLKEMDWREDPANAVMLLKLNLFVLENIRDDKPFKLVEHALRLGLTTQVPHAVRFLAEDESDVILPNIDGGIEGGLHGDRGANGSKGTINGIGNLDRKVNGADKHVAAIRNHAFFAGTAAKLDMGFNKGLSSWTQAHTITYVNGTRAIYSIWKGDWRAR